MLLVELHVGGSLLIVPGELKFEFSACSAEVSDLDSLAVVPVVVGEDPAAEAGGRTRLLLDVIHVEARLSDNGAQQANHVRRYVVLLVALHAFQKARVSDHCESLLSVALSAHKNLTAL